jgi:hypothetical protein
MLLTGLFIMRKPRPEAYDPKARQRKPEQVNMSGVVPLIPKSQAIFPTTPQPAPPNQNDDTVIPRAHGVMVSRHHDTTVGDLEEVIKTVRRAVKEFGKEPATHRFTIAEKNLMDEIEFTYKKRFRIRTSENEITRIAINYLFAEYQQKGDESILHRVLVSLNE